MWYLVELHGSGLEIPVSNERPIVGFYTYRRVFATSVEKAKAKAVNLLLEEPKVQAMLEETRTHSGNSEAGKISAVDCQRLKFTGWIRTRKMGLSCYSCE